MPKKSSKVLSINDHLVVLDVGTTSIKAFIFDKDLRVKARASRSLKKTRPKKDWVEQDPMEILETSKLVLKEACRASRVRLNHLKGFGLTNQRETIVAWDRVIGQPVYPAIVWEDRRGVKGCKGGLRGVKEAEKLIRRKTGLKFDPYFSAFKIKWVLENVPLAKKLVGEKRLFVGTLDTWLLWNLCENEPFLTDETNASRTLLFNIKKKDWDVELLKFFNVPREILPDVFSSGAEYGVLKKGIIGVSLSVLAVIGDQQASTFAAGTKDKTTKVTYGTGAFLVQSLDGKFKLHPDFFTTLLPTLGSPPVFALEAKVENCAAIVEPALNDPKKLRQVLTRIARKVDVAIKKLPYKPKEIIADGGVARDGIVIELQKNISGVPVRAQTIFDGTALGVAKMIVAVLKKK
jgi:glycerol kinase